MEVYESCEFENGRYRKMASDKGLMGNVLIVF